MGKFQNFHWPNGLMLFLWFAVLTSERHMVVAMTTESNYENWDVLVLAQGWPPSECVFLENEGAKCAIPDKVSSWLAHGLWPTLKGTEKPVNCDPQWKLNVTDLKNLRPALDCRWANLRQDVSPEKKNEDLWKHEWIKHGTCAASLKPLLGPARYFNSTLGLLERFDLLTLLGKQGISPSETKTYDYLEIKNAVAKVIGVPVCLVCTRMKKEPKSYYLHEIEIWMNKNFTLIGCDGYNVSNAMHSGADDPEAFTPLIYERSHCPLKGILFLPVHTIPLS